MVIAPIRKNRGSVLSMSLFYMLALSILALSAFEQSWISQRLSVNRWHRLEFSTASDNMLVKAERLLSEGKLRQCLLSMPLSQAMVFWSEDDWAHRAPCQTRDETMMGYTVVEALISIACGGYFQHQKWQQGVSLYRITIHTVSDRHQAAITLQSVNALPYDDDNIPLAPCDAKPQVLKLGRQSWRQIMTS